jgi:hypothetical protein
MRMMLLVSQWRDPVADMLCHSYSCCALTCQAAVRSQGSCAKPRGSVEAIQEVCDVSIMPEACFFELSDQTPCTVRVCTVDSPTCCVVHRYQQWLRVWNKYNI